MSPETPRTARSRQQSLEIVASARTTAAWVLYDIASSSYALMITGVAFPLFFKWTVTENAPWSDGLWGGLLAASSICAGLLGPLIGTAADLAQRRWSFLVWTTAISCLATILLAVPGMGVGATSVLFCLSLVSYHVSAGLYDALLKQVAPGRLSSWISSLGWGLGYVGGLLSYGLTLVAMTAFGRSGQIASREAVAVTGIYYAGLSLIALRELRYLTGRGGDVSAGYWRAAYRQVVAVIAGHQLQGPARVRVIGVGLVTGSAVALAVFSPLLFAGYFGLSSNEVSFLGAVFTVVSVPSTILGGFLALRIGNFRVFTSLLPFWLLFAVLLLAGTDGTMGLAAAVCLGLIMGPTQSLGRSLVSDVTAEDISGAMFGYAALVNRLAGAVGPLFFGVLSSATGDRFLPVLAATGTMLLGYFLLRRG